MKTFLLALFSWCWMVLALGATPSVLVLPIEGPIDPSTQYFVEQGLKQAEERGVDAVILKMDTPGGRVDITEEVVEALFDSTVPVHTWVEYNAISAGSIIACATQEIWMKPGSKIGDAMPVIMSAEGGYKEQAPAEREKIEAYVDALVRSIAERTGRDPALLSCLVRAQRTYQIGDEVICAEGEILTLTSLEATRVYGEGEDARPLLANGIAEDLPAMLEGLGLAGAELIEQDITWSEEVYESLVRVAPLLMSLGIMGLMISIYNPTFAAPGLSVAALCFALFFFSHHIAGLAGNEEVLIFLLGLALIALEIFVIPGFGVAGISGLLLMLGGLALAMVRFVEPVAPDPGQILPPDFFATLIPALNRIMLSLVLGGFGSVGLFALIPHAPVFRKGLILDASTSHEDGYDGLSDRSSLVGEHGTTLSELRPGGQARFGPQVVDVTSDGGFVERGQPVRVVSVRGMEVLVEVVEEEGTSA